MNDSAAAVAWLEDQFNRRADALDTHRRLTRDMMRWRRANPERPLTESPMWRKRLDLVAREALTYLFEPVGRPMFEFLTLEQDMTDRAPASWPEPQWDEDLDHED